MDVPGLTEYIPGSQDVIVEPIIADNSSKIILIATQNINRSNLFNNGLLQNIIFLYKLFEVIGYMPYFLLNSVANQQNSDILLDHKYRLMVPEDILKSPQPIHMYIEVGMSIEHTFIACLHSMGAKAVKLYYGNALNIDIENLSVSRYIQFPHHTYNNLDEMWTSPHYSQNLDYLCSLYRIPLIHGHIAPYLWDPIFLEGAPLYIAPAQWQETDIIIVEPNISFQKCALMPLILADTFAKNCPEWKGRVKCYNGNRLSLNTHTRTTIIPGLYLTQEKRLDFLERESIHTIMKKHPGGLFIGHQVNNEYNYMTLELMTQGFPILHSSSAWGSFGYYWTENQWDKALILLKAVMIGHSYRKEIYMSHAKQLAWAHSIHNPLNQKAYQILIE